MNPTDEMAGAQMTEYTPDSIKEITEILAPQAGNYTNAITGQIGQAQQSMGPLAAATMGQSRTAGLGNYTYNRLVRPQVDVMRDEILVQGYTNALNKMLSDRLSAAKRNYQNSSSSSNTSSKNSSNWTGDIEDKKASPDSTIWKKGNIGDNQATYGLYVLKRPAGLSDEDWYKQASEWMTKQSYSSRPQGGPGMLGN